MKIALKLCFLCMLAHHLFAFGPFDSKPYLTATASPTNSITINWNTESQESTIVAYGMTASLSDTVRFPGMRNYHHVTLTDLTPATGYFYRVCPDGDLKTFTTFPVRIDSFAFIVLGDTRTDSVAHQSVINRMAIYEFDFYMHSGDFVGDGNNTNQWRTFFNIEDTLLQSVHFLPTIGNHESPFWPYDTLFALPSPEDYYSVRYANTYYINLNTEIWMWGDQRAWLENELVTAHNDTLIDWIFVNLHRPPYSSGNHGSQLDVRLAWCSLFEDYDVDIVFAGHDHSYERTIPINGVVYIVTGGGGAPLYDVGSNWFTAHAEKTHHFCLIKIVDKKLRLKVVKPDGSVFDTLSISKNPHLEEKPDPKNVELSFLPNPFVNNLIIQFTITRREKVALKIYDCGGKYIKTIFDGLQSAGSYTVLWPGVDQSQNPVGSGVYFLIYEDESRRALQKVIKIGK